MVPDPSLSLNEAIAPFKTGNYYPQVRAPGRAPGTGQTPRGRMC
ncbi:MAG: hypothetical protein ACLSVD_19710 [Eggerthellaceae bacterium]